MISNPAGFWRRLLGNILDGLIISLPISLIFGAFLDSNSVSTVTSIIEILYAIILPVIWSGYTIGKRIVGVRIVKVNGEKIGFGTMLLRSVVGGLIYAVTLGIALIVSAIMVGTRKDKRAIHDFVAGTYVTLE
ncbi:RDD family protein [Neobacillus sp. LXY-4]|uniref:RDD family protein n=1 Tax=Neobacillus sp. LXY-4 TaxID=3379826 RepID=UPI003EE20BBA